MTDTNNQQVYIIQHYPLGWLYCDQINEDRCVQAYMNREINLPPRGAYTGYGYFTEYMNAVWSYSVEYFTDDGYLVRLYNNKAWVVVEADSIMDATKKGMEILESYYKSSRLHPRIKK